MTLARAWTRQLYGASGVALLAPLTMIAALAVLALSGGFGGLSALGQLVSGPAVPVASTPSGAGVPSRTAPLQLAVVPTGKAAAGAPGHAPTRVATRAPSATGTGTGRGTGAAPAPSGQRVASTGSGVTAKPPVATPPSATSPTPTQPAPTVSTPAPPAATGPLPALVNQVVAVGVSVTSQLPAPVAAIGTGALESLAQLLNTLLAPLS
jgi:hypothetical protein